MPANAENHEPDTAAAPVPELAEVTGDTDQAPQSTVEQALPGEPADQDPQHTKHEAEATASALEQELDELRSRHDELTRLLNEREASLVKLEQAYRHAHVERELASTLARQPLVDGAIGQLVKLWRDELDTREEGGDLKVVSRDGQPLSDAVEKWLDLPEYAHFSRPRSFGGAAQPGNRSLSRIDATEPLARNLGESVIQQWQRAVAQAGDGQAPIGLHRRRR